MSYRCTAEKLPCACRTSSSLHNKLLAELKPSQAPGTALLRHSVSTLNITHASILALARTTIVLVLRLIFAKMANMGFVGVGLRRRRSSRAAACGDMSSLADRAHLHAFLAPRHSRVLGKQNAFSFVSQARRCSSRTVLGAGRLLSRDGSPRPLSFPRGQRPLS
jgi:hypothetical protein